ncbi:Magnesium and cobalt efflux protein CorC [Posidoniimonas polymericola]|uniref:Magnesium and cobalt efflux protein CorC n=1 Tax=Posidoniimonas polymericola TaxID=2528002 RepID=A0A5C5XSL9_9BACT|nr:hemolysin family protein [Posidoniimonas polymericola]TWT65914.1 Magnesium and cobalt efflux protein CorC [Posidoniimonas polymericola]
MSPDALLWLAVISAVLTCLGAIGARTLREFSRHDLQELCQRSDRLDRFSEILKAHDRNALAAEILVVVCTSVFFAAAAYWALFEWFGEILAEAEVMPSLRVVVAGAALLGVGFSALRIWLPWSVSRLCASSFLYYTWPAWKLVGWGMTPVLWLAGGLDALLHRMMGQTPVTLDGETIEEEIRTIVTEGHREGLLEEDARGMIEGVMELGDVDVGHVMTPRTDMHMLQADTPWQDILADVIKMGHTRIPVYGVNRDDILGVLYVKDLLPELAKPGDEPRTPLAELVRKPVFVPESKAVDDLLEMFQQLRTHIAIVLDEYGGVAGLVTIEDVLEEIVGEIVDEYDPEVVQEVQRINEDVCEAIGRAHVDEINEMMGFDLPEDQDFDTIGGFVFSELGRVPVPGESFVWQELMHLTVVDASKRRVERVRVERLQKAAAESA